MRTLLSAAAFLTPAAIPAQADTLAEQYPGDREIAPMWWWDDEPGALPGVGGR